MTALLTITKTEAKLFTREPLALFFGLVFPSPLRPARLVLVQLIVHAAVAVVATLAALLVGRVVFDIVLPTAPLGFALVLLLGIRGLFGIGMLVAALAPTASAAQGMGMAFYFPLLFFAGVYFPIEVMSGPLRTVADLMPSGAVVSGLTATMAGAMPETRDLLVLAAYAAAFTLIAVRTFRWE